MIYDVQTGGLPDLTNRYDVCIVGAGPAGITAARSLVGSGRRVLLLEGGGLEFETESQEIYEGEVLGRDYPALDAGRLRYFGGTSNHWGGRCRVFDSFDFEARDDVPDTGWPITIDAIAPYLDEACEIAGTITFDDPRRPLAGTDTLEQVVFRWSTDGGAFSHALDDSPPRRWGEFYREELETLKLIDVLLNANVTNLALDTATARVIGVEFRTYSDVRHSVTADQVVLAMGGFENCRFLLNQNAAHGDRLGNQGGMVGRYFMEPLHKGVGDYFGTERLRQWTFQPDLAIDSIYRRQKPEVIVGPTRDFMREANIMNCGLRIHAGKRRPLEPKHVGDAPFVKDLRYDEDYFYTGPLFAASEQSPNYASRIVLIEDRDRFGQRRIGLDWQMKEIDRRTIRTVGMEAAKMMIRTGIGRVRLDDWVVDGSDPHFGWGNHHLGGARMSKTPETGVVDANCRVHGTPNLYVAGSAVFPTGGHANPTLTITQFALRLADHLASQT